MSRSCAHACSHTAKYNCIAFCGKPKGYLKEKIPSRYLTVCKPKYIHVNRHFWCRGLYVDTVGKNPKIDPRVYPEPSEKGSGIRSNDSKRVYKLVYGWVGKTKQIKRTQGAQQKNNIAVSELFNESLDSVQQQTFIGSEQTTG